ncbi:MAG: Ig-like domain-containing protein, partial [Polyangiaceae bacterium]
MRRNGYALAVALAVGASAPVAGASCGGFKNDAAADGGVAEGSGDAPGSGGDGGVTGEAGGGEAGG